MLSATEKHLFPRSFPSKQSGSLNVDVHLFAGRPWGSVDTDLSRRYPTRSCAACVDCFGVPMDSLRKDRWCVDAHCSLT